VSAFFWGYFSGFVAGGLFAAGVIYTVADRRLQRWHLERRT
jgi:hypothetical protein